MQQKLQAIADIFATLCNGTGDPQVSIYHYQAPDETQAPFVVWAEDDRLDLEAGNTHAEKAWQGTVDLYTHTEFDPIADAIETLLDANFVWYLESVQYEEETDLIHTEWVWSYA